MLLEDTRLQLLNKSKNQGDYKNQKYGKNRFERKRLSKISSADISYNKINMNDLFKQDTLIIKIPVIGETSSYEVSVKMSGIISELQKNLKNNKNVLEYKLILQAVTKIFNSQNIYINCTCKDYQYTYKYWNIVNNVSTDDSSDNPGPGKGIRNPKDEKGRGCKHCLLVLDNTDWLIKLSNVINSYLYEIEKKMTKPFLDLIFPKLYGIPADAATTEGLIDTDKYLKNSSGMIEAINKYNKEKQQ